ncbi:MAG: TadE/TadG family type IV pilus assembly protein [Ktedonobacterales bacterium]
MSGGRDMPVGRWVAVARMGTKRTAGAEGRVGPRSKRGERGQALLEFASFLVIILILVAGVVDVGGLLTGHVSIEYATRQAARTGAVLGNQPDADCAIVSAVNAALSSAANVTVTQIMIYNAGPDGQPTAGSESIYAGDPTCTFVLGVPTLSETANPDGYPPSSRNDTPYFEDSLGVQVSYTYAFQFPFVGNGVFQSSDYTVMPINPIVLPTPIVAPTPTPG